MLLSIVIPTFNRRDYLELLLLSMEEQLWGLADRIEVIVLDNASTDSTRSLVDQWRTRLPGQLHGIHREINCGGNPNIADAARRGAGKYVWVLGDDEIVPPSGLGQIMTFLEQNPDYLILNHALYDQSMERIRISRWLANKSDQYLDGREDAMAFLGPTPSFISAVIARRGILDCLDESQIATYATFGFNQLYAFYRGLTPKARGIVSGAILVRARSNDSGVNYDWNRYFITGMGRVFRDLENNDGYPHSAVQKALDRVIEVYHLPRLLNEKAEGRDHGELCKTAKPYFGGCWRYLLLRLIDLIPNNLLRLVKKIKRLKVMLVAVNKQGAVS